MVIQHVMRQKEQALGACEIELGIWDILVKTDRRLFAAGDLEDRFQLLTEEELDGIETFMRRKLPEKKEWILKG
ncbi:hypothetical protein CISG_04152 [Coccidioides immitis RMSCC 3703]|uniref:Uncharacterized protein n=1 Tax=Coccidioides immitis RMSCC 3703 TaxID=454286 RepID=A0A0J8QRA2_COCIT|nr:hypothetical protein CISG_04152 [Coccidioides immitis RMSCC 3703]